MSVDGRTVWWAKDAGWWRRERIVELGEEFGSAGPAVVDWLECEAKAQNAGGLVKTGYRAIARGIFEDVDLVCPVVSRSVLLGLLDDFEERDRTFTCRISGWAAEQQRAREAVKKAGQRAALREESPASDGFPREGTAPQGPAVSPPVPKCPPTGEERRVVTAKAVTERKENKENSLDRPVVSYRGKRVPAATVAVAVRLLASFGEATGRSISAESAGKPSAALKQICGALLARPDVDAERWEFAIRNTVKAPPAWVEGPLQIGHVFGEKAVEWALANDGTPAASGPAGRPADTAREERRARGAAALASMTEGRAA